MEFKKARWHGHVLTQSPCCQALISLAQTAASLASLCTGVVGEIRQSGLLLGWQWWSFQWFRYLLRPHGSRPSHSLHLLAEVTFTKKVICFDLLFCIKLWLWEEGSCILPPTVLLVTPSRTCVLLSPKELIQGNNQQTACKPPTSLSFSLHVQNLCFEVIGRLLHWYIPTFTS